MTSGRHGLVVAYLALFVGLGGSAFAVSSLGPSDADGTRVEAAKKKAAKRGPRGPRGQAGATNVTIRTATVPPSDVSGGTTVATAPCAPGEKATGGGFSGNQAGAVRSSLPMPDAAGNPVGWAVEFEPSAATRSVWAVCAAP